MNLNGFSIAALQHPRTTLGGIIAILAGLGIIAWQVKATLTGGEANGEQLLLAVGLLGGGWSALWAKDGDKSNAPSPTASATTTPKGFAARDLIWFLALGCVLAALFVAFVPRPARAQEAGSTPVDAPSLVVESPADSPAPPAASPALPPGLRFCLTASCSYSVQTGLAFGGTFYTRTNQGIQVFRNAHLAGLAVLGTPWPVDPVLGPAWQTGTAQGWGGTAGITEKRSGLSGTALASGLYVGGKVTWAFGLGSLVRF